MNNGAIEAWRQESSHKLMAAWPQQQDRAQLEHKLPYIPRRMQTHTRPWMNNSANACSGQKTTARFCTFHQKGRGAFKRQERRKKRRLTSVTVCEACAAQHNARVWCLRSSKDAAVFEEERRQHSRQLQLSHTQTEMLLHMLSHNSSHSPRGWRGQRRRPYTPVSCYKMNDQPYCPSGSLPELWVCVCWSISACSLHLPSSVERAIIVPRTSLSNGWTTHTLGSYYIRE